MSGLAELNYPPVNFFFRVTLLPPSPGGVSGGSDASFQEVTGISAELSTEPYREGGRNEYPHRLPVGTRSPNLVLKRGLVLESSRLFTWCMNTLGNGTATAMPIAPKDLSVDLLGADKSVLRAWVIQRSWPVKWEISRLHSSEGEVLVETLELTYDRFTVK